MESGIGIRLQQARKAAGLTQNDVARELGVTFGAVSQWERGSTSPKGTHLVNLSKLYSVRPAWLSSGKGPKEESDELVLANTELFDDEEPARQDEVDLPIFREVEFAAGDGRTQVIENHGASMRFSLAKLSQAGVQPENGACAVIKGDSMEPRIMSGATIGIDKGSRHIIDGKVYALDHSGMLRVKKLYRLPLDRIRVVSENSEEYPDEVYHLGSDEAPKIIGRVFWWEVFD